MAVLLKQREICSFFTTEERNSKSGERGLRLARGFQAASTLSNIIKESISYVLAN